MTSHPMTFTADEVRALLDGSKTQTRRVIQLPRWADPPNEDCDFEIDDAFIDGMRIDWPYAIAKRTGCLAPLTSPYGVVGDEIWVRETWRPGETTDAENIDLTFPIEYKADGRIIWHDIDALDLYPHGDKDVSRKQWLPKRTPYRPWRSPIHISQWASRIRRKIVGIRAERLQDITEEDAKAEGVLPCPPEGTEACPVNELFRPYACSFAQAWDARNAKRGHPWVSNPWVWVYDLEAV